MKTCFIITLFGFSFFTKAQTKADLIAQLKKIDTKEAAWKYVDENPMLSLTREFYNSMKDTSSIANELFQLPQGEVLEKKDEKTGVTSLYKVVQTQTVDAIRCRYVYLDGSKHSKKDIDKLRKKLLNDLTSGKEQFCDLAKYYSMDGTNDVCGDLGWMYSDQIVEPFVTAVMKAKNHSYFTIDVPEQKWYYVAEKLEENKTATSLVVLKAKTL